MRVITETNLRDFEFWSGAADTAKYLTDGEFDTIEDLLEAESPNGMTDTEINDFFWFEDKTIAEWLGYDSFDEIIKRED